MSNLSGGSKPPPYVYQMYVILSGGRSPPP